MKIEYTKYSDEYDPISIAWESGGERVEIYFGYEIIALYSKTLNKIVVEDFKDRKIKFFGVDGKLEFDRDIPFFPKYEFRGINKNSASKTDISFLFYPANSDVGNEWRDIEQFEVDLEEENLVGKRLGIFR